jgi:hypothetical protein
MADIFAGEVFCLEADYNKVVNEGRTDLLCVAFDESMYRKTDRKSKTPDEYLGVRLDNGSLVPCNDDDKVFVFPNAKLVVEHKDS